MRSVAAALAKGEVLIVSAVAVLLEAPGAWVLAAAGDESRGLVRR
jgi:hypothetical protein